MDLAWPHYYYRARRYDSGAGRFISKDPIGFNGGDTNLYRYVGSNPVLLKDPIGNCGTGLCIAIASATVGGVVGVISGYNLSRETTFFGKLKDASKGFAVGATGGFFAGVGAAGAILGSATTVIGGGLAVLGGIAIDAGITLIGLGDIATGEIKNNKQKVCSDK